MSRVPEQFIKKLQGKDFVLYSGLLELAHQDGLEFSDTEILQFPGPDNGQTCIVKALVRTSKGSFSGIGDASPTSVPNKTIHPHIIRMAETRAMARALRVATNVGMTAIEELGGDIDEGPKPKAQAQTQSQPAQKPNSVTDVQWATIKDLRESLNWDQFQLAKVIENRFGILQRNIASKMTAAQANELINEMSSLVESVVKAGV